jgi:hypothetical protein
LREEGFEPPLASQMTAFLFNIRSKQVSTASGSSETHWSLNDILNFAKTRQALPDDVDKVFVVGVIATANPIKRFGIFLTTRRLLSNALLVRIINLVNNNWLINLIIFNYLPI